MNLLLQPEQEELRRTVRRFLAERSPMATVRELTAKGATFDRDLWDQMAGELGLAGLGVPEEHGGTGCGPIELSLVMEELGRALVPTPFLSTSVLAVALLEHAPRAVRADLLPRIARGSVVVAVAVAEAGVGWDSAAIEAGASPWGDTWSLTGTKVGVLDGVEADVVLVAARLPDGEVGLFVLDGEMGVTRTRTASIDVVRPMASVELSAAPATLLMGDGVESALRHAVDMARLALAAEQTGALAACVDLTVDYAKERIQFGVPIGTFQAVKHGCADMHVDWELAYSALRHATWLAEEQAGDARLAISCTSEFVGRALVAASAATIQLHGGIGYTWEHDAHLFYKRARSAESLFGDRMARRAELLDELGI